MTPEGIVRLAELLSAQGKSLKELCFQAGLALYEVETLTEELSEITWMKLKAMTIYQPLDIPKKRICVAHGLGHFYLHRTNALYMTYNGLQKQLSPLEYEANLFAAHLLIPSYRLIAYRKLSSSLDLDALAKIFLVIPRFMLFRLLNP